GRARGTRRRRQLWRYRGPARRVAMGAVVAARAALVSPSAAAAHLHDAQQREHSRPDTLRCTHRTCTVYNLIGRGSRSCSSSPGSRTLFLVCTCRPSPVAFLGVPLAVAPVHTGVAVRG